MDSISTIYGELGGIEFRQLFSNKKIDGCLVSRKNVLETPYGNLVPIYEAEDIGRRSIKPVYFYKNGALKSISLQSRTVLDTPLGKLPAELVTFYKDGSLKRIFPLDGALSGFWSWKNEFELAEEVELDTPAGKIRAKIIGIQFYESGALKSLTFWPGQSVTIKSPIGETTARKGLAFYESGAVRSYEPLFKTDVQTPVGILSAYDNEPNGIHGDVNSLQFSREGAIEALCTADHEVEVSIPGKGVKLFKPGVKNNVCGDERKIVVPMKVRFTRQLVIFHDNTEYSFELAKCGFTVRKTDSGTEEPLYSCAG
ncbi:MAG: hypothetical protein HGA70_03280 [Chlorobiaceae bacterium]|nr:hypothetical protein [Chlorobiaceae bacterium]NTW11157.1 hypothetical protein [Chlorobiaceae bacterium]